MAASERPPYQETIPQNAQDPLYAAILCWETPATHMPDQPHILLIDDEQHIVDIVVYVLEEHGYRIHTALDGLTGLQLFRKTVPSLVILDLNLPGMQGLDVFREMKTQSAATPIIMLTSRAEEIDRILGLEMGADDYVTKPFSPRELAARVRAVLRRTNHATPQSQINHGPFSLDPDACSLTYFGKPMALTRAEFRLTECLIRYPARVFTRDMLINRLYDGEHVVTDRSIDACIKRLRKKFEEVRPDVDPIETVHGLGYKLRAAIEGI